MSELIARTDALLPGIRSDLEELVRIPSVSADSFDQAEVARSAQAVAALLEPLMDDVEVITLETAEHGTGRPAVLATRRVSESAPTVLLYAHHDVQPEGELDAWDSEPFEPVERDGRLYGRGTADDKAGIMVHVGALRVLAEELGELPVNVTIFIEGEEEIGSPTFVDFLQAHRDTLKADVMIVADSNNWRAGTPSLTTSLRGVVGLHVQLDVLDHALHSGMYGGPVLDAVTLMSRLIYTLHDDDGAVAIPGLLSYDDAQADYTEDQLRIDAGILDGVHLAGRGSIASRLWTQPALAVIGLDATSTAKASNTILPSCTARLSLRIAPGQDPREAVDIFTNYVKDNAPFGAQVTVTTEEAGPSFKATETPVMGTAREALKEAYGVDPVDIGVGGSIPFIADLAKVFPEAEILVTGIEDPDTRAHSSNESLHLGDFRHNIIAEAMLLKRLGEGGQH